MTASVGLVASVCQPSILRMVICPDASSAQNRCYGVGGRGLHLRRCKQLTECPMPQPIDLSRSLTVLDPDSTLVAVIEMSQSSWLVAGIVPGIERQPLKKLEPDAEALLALLHRWRDDGVRAGKTIKRLSVAYEAGRDGFWLARWLRARGVEAHVIHPASVAVSREHRRAKTDRLDTEFAEACVSRLATWRAKPLQHGGGSDARRRRCQAPEP